MLKRCEKCKELDFCDSHHVNYGFYEQRVNLCKKCHAIVTSLNTLAPRFWEYGELTEKKKAIIREKIFVAFLKSDMGKLRKKSGRMKLVIGCRTAELKSYKNLGEF